MTDVALDEGPFLQCMKLIRVDASNPKAAEAWRVRLAARHADEGGEIVN